MTVSQDQVTEWCTQLINKSPDFASLEECIESIPNLDSIAECPAGTRVLVRGDTDVVVSDTGTIEEDVRLRSLVETLKFGCEHNWVQLVYGHRGRDPKLSLEPVAGHLKTLLTEAGVENPQVSFIGEWLNDETGEVLDSAAEAVAAAADGTIIVLENTRRYEMERVLWKASADDLSGIIERVTNYANSVREKLATIHVNEGFAASNRDLSSTIVPLTMDHAVLGKYIESELVNHVTKTRQAELVIFSGIKINKLDDLEQILNRGSVKMVIAAGSLAMALKKANANINGEEFEMGLSNDPDEYIYIPPDRIEQATAMLKQGIENGVKFVLPLDFIIEDGTAVESIPPDGALFDVGPQTIEMQADEIGKFIEFSNQKVADGNGPAIVFHNGVFGKFEEEQYANGTRMFISQLKRMHDAGVTVYVGGGEGGAALMRYGNETWVTHCFTAGGTLLKALGSEPIPYLKALFLKSQQ